MLDVIEDVKAHLKDCRGIKKKKSKYNLPFNVSSEIMVPELSMAPMINICTYCRVY